MHGKQNIFKKSIGEFTSVTTIPVRNFEKIEAKFYGLLTSTPVGEE